MIRKDGWFMPGWVLRDKRISLREKMVLSVVCNLTDIGGCRCANRFIGEQLGISIDSVKQAVVRLRKKGLLQPNAVAFPGEFKGARLVPIYPRGLQDSTTPVLNCNPPVPKTHTDTINTISQREREEAANHKPGFSRSSIIAATIAGSDIPEHRAGSVFDRLYSELSASGTVDDVFSWPVLIRAAIAKEDKPAASPRWTPKVAPAPVSQFSRSH